MEGFIVKLIKKIGYDKVNPRTKKIVKIIKRTCSICGRNISQIFTKYRTKGEDFIKKRRCKNKHRSAMSNSAWCDLNSKGDILELQDICPSPKCNCQKTNTFTPHQNMLDRGSTKSIIQKFFRGTKQSWDSFSKPGLKMATPLISSAVAAKTQNPQSAQITNNLFEIFLLRFYCRKPWY